MDPSSGNAPVEAKTSPAASVICELLGKLENSVPFARVPYAEKRLDQPEFLAPPHLQCIVVHGQVVPSGSLIAGR
jgi:hypothetical protein